MGKHLNFGNLSFYRKKNDIKEDGTFEIFIRYNYSLDGKSFRATKTTKQFLLESEFQLLKYEKLKGQTAKKLYEIFDQFKLTIESIRNRKGVCSIETFKKFEVGEIFEEDKDPADSFDYWENRFLLGTKPTSSRQYGSNLKHFKKFLYLCPDFIYKGFYHIIDDRRILTEYKNYILQFNSTELFNTMVNKLTTTKRFLNKIYKTRGLPLLQEKIPSLKNEKEQLTLIDEEVKILINFDIDSIDDDTIRGKKGNPRIRRIIYKTFQSIIKINTLLSLRISDNKTIKKQHIDFSDPEFTVIKVYDKKSNSDYRDVVIKNNKMPEVINELKKLVKNANEDGFLWWGKFLEKTSKYDQYLKDYAKLCGLNREVEYYNTYVNGETIVQKGKVSELITSHAFRRYAIHNNLNDTFKGNIKQVQAYSGHKSLDTMTKYYTKKSSVSDQKKAWNNLEE